MKPAMGGICPLAQGSAMAAGPVKRRIPLDAHEIARSKIISFKINLLLARSESAQIRGKSLKPFCNHAMNTFGHASPTDLSTSPVDNAATAAHLLGAS